MVIDSENKRILRFRYEVLKWYNFNGRDFPWRKKGNSNYKYIISEVLLQRTSASIIAKYYPKFVTKYPSWKKLSKAPLSELETMLKPLGLWRKKAIAISKLAEEMNKRRGRFPKAIKEIEGLPGVGQYIANSILLFCHEKPAPLLDFNMARVIERYFGPRKLADIRYDPFLQEITLIIVNCNNSKEINWAILDFAALVCKKNRPLCAYCPLTKDCSWLS